MLKLGEKEVKTKDFYGQRQITDIFTIDVNNVVVSDKVPCNNGKDCRYIVGYQAIKIWNEVESQLFEKMATELIEREGRYINGKLKTWKEHIKTNFHGPDVPYDMHCNATAVLKIGSVYKQGKNYHPQIYAEEFKYTDPERKQCIMLVDDDDDGFFEV